MGSPHSEEKRETQSGMSGYKGASHKIECGEITDVKIKEIIGAPHRVECGENNVTVGNSTHSKLWAALQSEEW